MKLRTLIKGLIIFALLALILGMIFIAISAGALQIIL